MYAKFKESREAAMSKSWSQTTPNGNGNGNANGHAEPNGDANTGEVSTSLPPLKYKDEDPEKDEGWITFDKPICYLYAGQGPFISVDMMQFPVSLPNDGFIDVVLQEVVSITGPSFRPSHMLTKTVDATRRDAFCHGRSGGWQKLLER